MAYKTKILATLCTMETWELVRLWDEYKQVVGYYDDEIFSMEELDDLMSGSKPSEIIERLSKSFDIREDWFRFTIFGMESTDDPREWIDRDEMADYMLENDDCLYNDDIRQILAEKSKKEQETA